MQQCCERSQPYQNHKVPSVLYQSCTKSYTSVGRPGPDGSPDGQGPHLYSRNLHFSHIASGSVWTWAMIVVSTATLSLACARECTGTEMEGPRAIHACPASGSIVVDALDQARHCAWCWGNIHQVAAIRRGLTGCVQVPWHWNDVRFKLLHVEFGGHRCTSGQ